MNKIYTVRRIALNDDERVRSQSFGWMEIVNSQLFCSEFGGWGSVFNFVSLPFHLIPEAGCGQSPRSLISAGFLDILVSINH